MDNYYQNNRESIRTKQNSDPERMKEYNRQNYLKHAESNRKYAREYYRSHKEEHKAGCKTRHHLHKNEPHYKLAKNMRRRVHLALRGNPKHSTTFKLVGCGIEELKIYIENLFQIGMTWNNYGQWHIDHIIPCASFDLSKEKEQRKCFHYTNLQPLWAHDNLSKGSK